MVAPVKPQKVGKQAKDDFVGAEDVATTFDLLANDGGGPNVSLFSVNQIDPFNVQISARTALGATVKIVNGRMAYDPTGSASIQALAQGQTATDLFTYAIIDFKNGMVSTATAFVTVTGTNEAPIIVAAVSAGSVTKNSALTASGTISFTDVDLTDHHSVSLKPAAAGYAGVFARHSRQTQMVGTTGVVTWVFSISNDQLQSLGPGQQLVQRYSVIIDDGHGGTASQDVTITIYGAGGLPSLAINAIAGDDILNATEARQALAIGGTSNGVVGQPITVTFNGAHYSGLVGMDGSWSVTVPIAALVGTVLPDGTYEVTADTTDQDGNAVPQAS